MTRQSPAESPPLCPSAQPGWEGSVAIGVVGGTAARPRLAIFAKPRRVSLSLLQLSAHVDPTEVFRFAAPCLCKGCMHFRQDRCGLVQRIVDVLPPAAKAPPACPIRGQCRWWEQEGVEACLRCPQVVTKNHNPSEAMVVASTPTSPA